MKNSNDVIIEIERVYKSFGRVQAVVDVSLDIYKGEVVFIFGPSGGGKSTLLRCINRLETVDRGRIVIDGSPFYTIIHYGNRSFSLKAPSKHMETSDFVKEIELIH